MEDLVVKSAWDVVKEDALSKMDHSCNNFNDAIGLGFEAHMTVMEEGKSAKLSEELSDVETKSGAVEIVLRNSDSIAEFISILSVVLGKQQSEEDVILERLFKAMQRR